MYYVYDTRQLGRRSKKNVQPSVLVSDLLILSFKCYKDKPIAVPRGYNFMSEQLSSKDKQVRI